MQINEELDERYEYNGDDIAASRRAAMRHLGVKYVGRKKATFPSQSSVSDATASLWPGQSSVE